MAEQDGPGDDDVSAAIDALTDAFAGLVHELRTPVTGVVGATDLLAATELDEAQTRYVEILQRSSSALLTQVNNLLDLRRSERDQLSHSREAFYLYELLEAAFDVVSDSASRAGVLLSYELAPQTPTYLEGDQSRLLQILLNLLHNAVKYAAGAPVLVEVSSSPRSDGEVDLHCSVTDHGPGVPEALRAHLFEPFWQLRGNAQQARGTGLGLAVSAQVAKAIGGALTFAPGTEGGARFTLTAPVAVQRSPERRTVALPAALLAAPAVLHLDAGPLADQLTALIEGLGASVRRSASPSDVDGPAVIVRGDAQVAAPPSKVVRVVAPGDEGGPGILVVRPLRRLDVMDALVQAATGQQAARLRQSTLMRFGGRALLVDGGDVGHDTLATMLRERAFSMDVARDVLSAARAVEQRAHDLVLIRVDGGGFDVVATTKSIRAVASASERSAPKIVALSARARPSDGDRWRAAGCDELLAEPLTRDALRAVIDAPASPPGEDVAAGAPRAVDLAALRMALVARDWEALVDEADALQGRAPTDGLQAVRDAAGFGSARQAQAAVDALASSIARDTTPVVPEGADTQPARPRATVDDDELVRAMMPKFIAQRQKEAEELRAAEDPIDFKQLHTIAHRISGTSETFGFADLGGWARTLSEAARDRDEASCRPALKRVLALIEELE